MSKVKYLIEIAYKNSSAWEFETDDFNFINSRWLGVMMNDGNSKFLNTDDMEVINVTEVKEDNVSK